MLVDNGIGTYKTDKNLIPKIIELRTVYYTSWLYG